MRILLGAVLLVFALATAEGKPLSEFTHGNWSGGAFANDTSGKFSHCAASSPHRHGVDLLVSIDGAYVWSVAFASDGWTLKTGDTFPIRLRFDKGPWLDFEAVALRKDMAAVVMPTESTLIALFRRGQVMDLDLGRAPVTFALTGTYRLLARLLDCVDQRLAMEGGTPPPAPPSAKASRAPEGPSGQPGLSSGTGFVVSGEGHIVSNAHVVSACGEISIRRSGEVALKADLVADDQTNDLALLKVTDMTVGEGGVARLTTGRSPPAGARIAVYGFPLAGALSSTGNIVEGNITAAAGIADDINHFQISAPIQPGNSGGPLLDFGGGIVGVVNAKLNELALATATGSLPQNVNFAIKGNVLANFLEAHSIAYDSAPRGPEVSLVDIAERAKRFTVLVVCAP